jgi:hypothetical protein
MVRTALIVLVFAASACAAKEAPLSENSPGHSPPMPAPRDGQVAVQEEFEAAAKANTSTAWDLFIRRHPDNPLTQRAKAARAAMEGRS